jgi:hypothetical protein
MMDTSEQLPLFEAPTPEVKPAPASPPPLLTPRSPLSRALGEFESYMQRRGFTENTQQAFRLDLQILAEYLTRSSLSARFHPLPSMPFSSGWRAAPRFV